MNSPFKNKGVESPETTRAWFWQERKWQWLQDAILFAVLGAACVWPMIAAGGAIVAL